MAGTIEIVAGGKLQLRYDTESNLIAWRIFEIIRRVYSYGCEVQRKEGMRLYKHSSYRVRVTDTDVSKKMLDDMGILMSQDDLERPLPTESMLEKECCKKSFLRGAFLASGSVSDPSRGYHLEIVIIDDELARTVSDCMQGFGLSAHTITRNDTDVVYLRDSESIVDMLNLIGAVKALLEMENIMVEKNYRNNVNRAINCETANLDKTMSAAARQYKAIATIERAGKFRSLSPELRAVAEARMENPQATLRELSDIIPDVSKSGVNHRLRKLIEIAENLSDSIYAE